ncbi:fatty acid cis/trans isomerase, partial [Roseibium denhamense]
MRRLPEKHARICGRYTLLAASRRLFRAAVLVLAVSLMLGTNGRVQAEGVVQDTLNKRCVVCHGCYDAPCQLKLSSPEGWLRGASKQKVYESSRLEDAPLTRLGVDATTTSEWRQKGFFPVTGNDPGGSILAQLIAAGRTPEFELGAALPDSVDLDLSRDLSCPAPGETAQYLKEHPMGGMPYAMAPLPEEDYQQLMAWAMAGAPAGAGAARELPSRISQHVSDIEAFLNGPDTRTRLVARYIYEHLFLAHLHIEGDRSDRFFRLIRSKTPAGTPPQDVATRRPFDDPGTPFTYRLVPISGTILHKEHIVYEIGPTRLARYKELFLDPDWTLSQLPPYSTAAGGNPLSTFRAIPARSRYQFLLDNAEYFVRSFIRGPVCYGQVAVNVIEDRFWVSFLDPDEDLSVSDQAYLNQIVPILELPVALSDGDLNDRITSFLERGPVKYQELRQQRYAREAAENGPPAYAHIWDGDGTKPDARLTVYRNFSSASVVSGFAGRIPETAWVIDFPLFERIYYNLVAGFDVFGNVEHQLTTRIYMDNLRREGERNFLSFLPPDQRQPLHDGWYRGPFVSLMDRWKETPLDTHTPTGIAFGTQNPKQEFLTRLLEIQPQLWDMT